MNNKGIWKVRLYVVITIILGLIFTKVLSEMIADMVLPYITNEFLIQNGFFIDYKLYIDDVYIPTATSTLITNGKLFAFCQSISSILVGLVFYLITISKLGMRVYEKCDKNNLGNYIKRISVILLFLGLFTFTSKANFNFNFEYKDISMSETTENIIGYINASDLNGENQNVPVYDAPQVESSPKRDDLTGKFFVSCIKNIDKINLFAEVISIILGIFIYILNDFQKRNIETNS